MANRRFGGGPGGQRGGGFNNRSFGGGGPQSNINPWQGGGPSGGGGNAPPPNSNNSNIQNQLAMALSSLIQQTKPQPPSGPPSLLNMNNQSGFYNQDNFNQSQNRFGGNRGGQDFRPFNKNGGVGGGGGGGARPWGGQGPPNRIVKRPGNFRNNNKNQRTPNNKGGGPKRNDTPTKPKPTPFKAELKQDNKQKDEDTKNQAENAGSETRTPAPSPFDGLPKGLMHCFVCLKTMWDGESFQNHIGGKAHKQMIGSLEESFQITVNILRENMRLSEERKMIEIQRYQRLYRHKNVGDLENYCNMCDLKFVGKIAVHRQTEGHQRLKRFLHPKCHRCNLEFPYRMEWVDHHFTKEHLFKLKEFLDTKDLAPEEYKVKIQAEMDIEPLLEETVHNEDDNPVLELSDDLNNLFNRIPAHKRTRAVAKASLEAASGFICNLCKYFMTTKEESEAHLKTVGHHKHFVKALKIKHQKALNKKKKAEDAEATTAANGESKDEEKKEEEGDDEENKAVEDMYDPFEADGNEEEEEKKEDVEVKEEMEVDAKEEEKEEAPVPEAKTEPEVKPEVKAEIKKEAAVAPATPNTRPKRVVKNTPAAKAKKGKN